ncbi:MAG: hypothetical protein AAF441_08870 [Pseudomonadota bacterium]
MTTGKPVIELEAYVDGECSLDDSVRIRAELEKDAALAKSAGQLDALNHVLRAEAEAETAPDHLRAAMSAKYGVPTEAQAPSGWRGRLGRRGFLFGAGSALAAGVAGVAVVSGFQGLGSQPETAVETFFHDFETYLAKDKSIDIAETSMIRLAEWYGSRLPFELPPVGSSAKSASLIGGRLCWLLERRLASLSYEAPEGSMVLYIMNGDGIAVPEGQEDPSIGRSVSWHRSSGNTSLVWRSGELLYVMVSQLELRRLMSVARELLG